MPRPQINEARDRGSGGEGSPISGISTNRDSTPLTERVNEQYRRMLKDVHGRESGAPPNRGPSTPVVDSGVTERPLSLSAIRHHLTHDLTMTEAHRLFGAPHGPTFISGLLYPLWLLDDGNRLTTALAIDSGRLLRADVMRPGGEIVERVLEDPKP